MPKRATMTTQEYLTSAPLPEQTETYTVISHESIINKTREMLTAKGFGIERELYRCNDGAQVAQGVYHLKYGNDPDMSMMFCWSNSYDKSMKFKCSIGGYVHASLASIIGSNMGNFVRKHTGTADNEAYEIITSQIENAEEYFKQLVSDKETMKSVPVPELMRAKIMGQLYFMHELLTGEQLGIVRAEFNKPSFVYTGVPDSLWSMYNAVIYSLQKAHPKTWMDQQSMIHYLLCELFQISPSGALSSPVMEVVHNSNPVEEQKVDPAQVDLEDSIKELTGQLAVVDQKIEAAQEKRAELILEAIIIPEFTLGEPEIEMIVPASKEEMAVRSNELGDSHTTVETLTEAEIKEKYPEVIAIVEKQVEKVLGEELKNNSSHTMLPGSAEIPEVIQEEKAILSSTEIEDASWPCLKCGESQGPSSAWNDGQLCTTCYNSIP